MDFFDNSPLPACVLRQVSVSSFKLSREITIDTTTTSTKTSTMTNFFDLPVEIRLDIYKHLFGAGKVILTIGRSDSDSLLPAVAKPQTHDPRSSQLLAVCKTILEEARPVLYANTTFHVLSHVFAGKLPSNFTDGAPLAPFVKHLIWQVDCDMMKFVYEEDLKMEPSDLAQLSSLEIRCRAETWRGSFLGESCDRDRFVQGREQTISYAKYLQKQMADNVNLVEDRTFLGKGCVRLRLGQGRAMLLNNVSASYKCSDYLRPR